MIMVPVVGYSLMITANTNIIVNTEQSGYICGHTLIILRNFSSKTFSSSWLECIMFVCTLQSWILIKTISDNCLYTTGHRCINGACLDSQCHCNDGWGGKGCSMPDENECKYRSVLLWNTLYIICILLMIYCDEIAII